MTYTPRPRLRGCVEAWPDCEEGEYHPSCCRFPKSCSCTVYDPERVQPEDLEDPIAAPGSDSPGLAAPDDTREHPAASEAPQDAREVERRERWEVVEEQCEALQRDLAQAVAERDRLRAERGETRSALATIAYRYRRIPNLADALQGVVWPPAAADAQGESSKAGRGYQGTTHDAPATRTPYAGLPPGTEVTPTADAQDEGVRRG